MAPATSKTSLKRGDSRGWLFGFCLLLAMLSNPALAQDGDAIELSADSADVRDAEGISIYRGDVVLTRANKRITGALMRVYTDEQRELERIEVEGTPATFREQLPEAAPRRAEAPRMEYFASGPERVILSGGGRLWQDDNEVTGSVVTHYFSDARTVAESDEGSDERVNVTVYQTDDDNP